MKKKTQKKPTIPSPVIQKPDKSVLNKRLAFCIIILVCVTALLFSNAITNGYTNWDDNDYVTDNTHIRHLNAQGLKEIFTVFVSCHYHPFTLLSLAINYQINGLNPAGYIIGNIMLHILSVVLVFFIFYKLSKRYELAFITALLFSIHPMRVESVVWISERKDVLFTFFYLFSLFFYLKYLKKEGNPISTYIIALVLFACSILSKATAATLPILFFAFDYYMKRKFNLKLFLEKIPFLAIAIGLGYMTVVAQSSAEQNSPPLLERPFLDTYALSFYLIKFFAPVYQCIVIPFPVKAGDLLPLKYYISFLIVPLLILIYFLFKKGYRREYLLATLFFIIPLGGLLTKFPIGPAYLAERYTYISHIGVAYFIGFLYVKLSEKYKLKNNFKNPFLIILLVVSVLFAVKTFYRNPVWKDSLTLWNKTIKDHPRIAAAYYNRGNYKKSIGDNEGALYDYNKTLEIKPDLISGYFNRSGAKQSLKDYEGAIQDLNKAIELKPNFPEAYYNKAVINKDARNFPEVMKDINKVIEFKFKLEDAYNIRGIAYSQLGNDTAAIADYTRVLEINPHCSFAYEVFNNRGYAKAKLKLFQDAILDYNQAIALKPDNSMFYVNRGNAFFYLGQKNNACMDWSKAAELGDENGKSNLASVCR